MVHLREEERKEKKTGNLNTFKGNSILDECVFLIEIAFRKTVFLRGCVQLFMSWILQCEYLMTPCLKCIIYPSVQLLTWKATYKSYPAVQGFANVLYSCFLTWVCNKLRKWMKRQCVTFSLFPDRPALPVKCSSLNFNVNFIQYYYKPFIC